MITDTTFFTNEPGYALLDRFKKRDLCKTPLFAQLLRHAQILILEIFNIFLLLKFSPSLYLNKIEHFSKLSKTLKHIGSRFPESVLLKVNKSLVREGKKLRYPKNLRIKMFRTIIDAIKKTQK